MICIVVKKNCLLDMIFIQSILRLLFFHFDISRKLGELECLFIIESYCSSYDGNKFVETNLIGINSPWNSNLAWRKLRNLMKITKIHWVYYVIVWYWCLLNRYFLRMHNEKGPFYGKYFVLFVQVTSMIFHMMVAQRLFIIPVKVFRYFFNALNFNNCSSHSAFSWH